MQGNIFRFKGSSNIASREESTPLTFLLYSS